MIEFDDLKSELIHFEKSRNSSTDIMELPNETILQSQKWVKYLEVFLDRKLNFNIHVQKQLNSANRALHGIANLMKSEWGLSASACRQLYVFCIISISDYGSEIWFNGKNQKHLIDKFQKIQNFAIRKILEAFKTTPFRAMEIEANILPPAIRLHQKNQQYAIRIARMRCNNPLTQICLNSFSQNFEHLGHDVENQKFVTWTKKITNIKD